MLSGPWPCLVMQEAAGAFAHLRDVAALRVEQPRPVDISPECASMLERLCLAQAQECVFEKARADKKSSALLARCVRTCECFEVFKDSTKVDWDLHVNCPLHHACYGSQGITVVRLHGLKKANLQMILHHMHKQPQHQQVQRGATEGSNSKAVLNGSCYMFKHTTRHCQ